MCVWACTYLHPRCAELGYRVVPLVRVIIFLFYPVAKPVAMTLDCLLGKELGTLYTKKEVTTAAIAPARPPNFTRYLRVRARRCPCSRRGSVAIPCPFACDRLHTRACSIALPFGRWRRGCAAFRFWRRSGSGERCVAGVTSPPSLYSLDHSSPSCSGCTYKKTSSGRWRQTSWRAP